MTWLDVVAAFEAELQLTLPIRTIAPGQAILGSPGSSAILPPRSPGMTHRWTQRN